MAGVGKPGQAKLQKAERAWLAYRDAQCDFDTMGTSTGSIYPMIYAGCLNALTQTQMEHLNQQLHCKEGDLSCGGQQLRGSWSQAARSRPPPSLHRKDRMT
jgi:Lysozyme inhibitor LprI